MERSVHSRCRGAIDFRSADTGVLAMNYRFLRLVMPWVGLVAVPGVAEAASLEKCGDVFVSGDASCEFVRDRECEEHCEVVSVEQSCTAELYHSCENNCTAETSTTCTETCSPVCVQVCSEEPTPKTSAGLCRSDCAHDCNTKCAGAENGERCHSACSYTCNKQCGNRCREDDQEVACEERCTTACDGTCTSTSVTACQIDCQTTQIESCQTTVVEKCRTDCRDKGGAIFCDGQFLNASNLEDCADELRAEISIDLDIDVDIDTSVDIDNDGDDDVGCSFAPAGDTSGGLTVAALAAFAALARRRRR
jgi:MYXO-CTERM domain-containing protein